MRSSRIQLRFAYAICAIAALALECDCAVSSELGDRRSAQVNKSIGVRSQNGIGALTEAAAQRCEADQGIIARKRDGAYQRVATYGFSHQFTELVKDVPVKPERGSATGRALLDRKIPHIPDVMRVKARTPIGIPSRRSQPSKTIWPRCARGV